MIPRVVWMTGFCSESTGEQRAKKKVITIDVNNRSRDGKGPADVKTGTENNGGAAGGQPPVQHAVERVTALRGQAIAKPPAVLKTRRKTGEQDLLADSDIPYEELEKALRGVLCSLVERQDRAHEALLLRINDLQYRMDDAEYDLRELGGTGSRSGKRKV